MGQINTYVDEMMTKFIMGDMPISKYDEFANTIKGMGIEQAQKIYEDAYARYQKR
jgi:putative aldouronate transport system substrate-binding protein